MIAIRSIITIAASTLVLASCASADREDDGDRQTDELGTIQQEPHSAVCSGGQWSCKAQIRTDANHAIKPFATPAGLGPADLASAYKLNPAKTSTATIAIVDAFHYPNAESDLATYRSQFGLPPCTKANGCLKIVNQNGQTSPLPGTAPANDDWTVEAALDLDLASAACPTCKLVLVEAQDDQGNGLFVAQNAAAAMPGVVAISDSWGGPSDGTDVTLDSQFFNHPGVNIFVASGDNGNTGTTPDYPSTSAHVIGVGGTSLVKSTSNARGWTEGAWSGAGSSCSTKVARPAFQTQTVCGTAQTPRRAAADISAVADPNTGLAVFNAGAGGWIVVGGTSAASPFVAGVYARYGITAPNDASYAYAHASQFFDVTTGKNGTCGGALCNAGAGWDGPTGIGTPNGASLGGGGGTCTPSCNGKTCGDDGCGGTCGTCGSGQTCSPGGTCTGGGSCSHPICSTGGKLTESCDPCAQEVCAADSFCCNNSWDSVCVGEVASICHQTCGGGTCAHAICATGSKLTASCDSCAAEICAADSFCCNNKWDAQCVSEVSSVCHQSCN
ncbi:MAG TPA: S53 family peptidase [Kofleriaceae bacterium]|nr:S53 family peptidase [Kofleriaceae bacterium]